MHEFLWGSLGKRAFCVWQGLHAKVQRPVATPSHAAFAAHKVSVCPETPQKDPCVNLLWLHLRMQPFATRKVSVCPKGPKTPKQDSCMNLLWLHLRMQPLPHAKCLLSAKRVIAYVALFSITLLFAHTHIYSTLACGGLAAFRG